MAKNSEKNEDKDREADWEAWVKFQDSLSSLVTVDTLSKREIFNAGRQSMREEWEKKVNELFCTIANNNFTPYEILDLIDRTFEKEPAKGKPAKGKGGR